MSSVNRMPAEWELHSRCWLAWPYAADLWQENLKPAQSEFVDLCRAISGVGLTHANPVEPIFVLVPARFEEEAREALDGVPCRFFAASYGDIWLRDTAPIFVDQGGVLVASLFRFNGWGGKYVLDHDDKVSLRISEFAETQNTSYDWVLEGGAIEVDGLGTCLTTRQCLLNSNRGANLTEGLVEERFAEAFGVTKTVWIDRGLERDHTDGHIDTLARFVSPGTVVCMMSQDKDDPNRETLRNIRNTLVEARDARNNPLRVIEIPSPGHVRNSDGETMPASYLNFYIANRTVVVPTYGSPWDARAVEAISRCFPNRKTVGLSAKAILSGGGAFHCITQQEPDLGIEA